MTYLRIGLAVVALMAAGWLAHRVSLSFSQADELAAQRDHIDALARAAARDTRVSMELARFRAQQADQAATFRDELAKKPLTKETVHYVNRETGETVVCRERDPARYRELFNSAVTGSAVVR